MIENNNLEAARFQYDTTRGPSTEVHDQNIDCKNKEILELFHFQKCLMTEKTI